MPARRKKPAPYRHVTMPSGLTVVLREMPHAESASVGIWVRAGGRFEPPAIVGVSHFLEHLLFKGTRTRTCEELKRAVEGVGGSLNGFTAEEFTCYMAKLPAKHLARALAVLCDMALHPSLASRDIDKERDVILEEIRMYDDTPGQHVHEVFNQLLWPNHPLGNLLAGSEQSVRGLSHGVIRSYWRRFYQPRNMLIAVAGNFVADDVIAQLGRLVRPGRREALPRSRPAPRSPRGPLVRLLHKKTEQTHVCLGTPAIARMHPQRFAVELLHVLLGANMSSRLFHEVRERRGLVYEIGTQIKRYRDAGAFIVYAGCDAAKLTTTIRTIITELGEIKRHPVSPRELRRAKDFYAGQLVMALEDTLEHMLWMGEQAITVGGIGTPQALAEAIEQVTPEQIQRAASRLFTSRQLFAAIVGPVPVHQAATLQRVCAELQ